VSLLFLDRDGTLMHDVGYPRDPADVRLLSGAAEAVRALAALGYVPAVVSNQSGVGRGRIAPAEAEAVHLRFVEQFAEASGLVLPCSYCPHGPDDDCMCRKPKPGLLIATAQRLGLPIGRTSIMIGDKESDAAAGRAAGCGLNLRFRGDWAEMLEAIRSLTDGRS